MTSGVLTGSPYLTGTCIDGPHCGQQRRAPQMRFTVYADGGKPVGTYRWTPQGWLWEPPK